MKEYTSFTTSLIFTGAGLCSFFLAIHRSLLTVLSILSSPSLIRLRYFALNSGSPPFCFNIWRQLKSPPSGLFISWATPAARMPMDASFSDWTNFSWVLLSSSFACFILSIMLLNLSPRRASSSCPFTSTLTSR